MSPPGPQRGAPTWDAEVLARVARLHLRARQAVDGLLHGAHRSAQIAANVEFAEYKEYSPGDPLRDIDWRVAARSDRLVVRRHQAESELPVIIALDASGDMDTGSDGRVRPPLEGNKFGYALSLAATLAWFLGRRSEPVGLWIMGGRGGPDGELPPATRFFPPRAGRSQLAAMLAQLADLRPGGEARLGASFQELGQRAARRGIVVVISDLMEEPAAWGPSLAALRRRQVDLRVAQLFDEAEWRFEQKEPARFFSPEGGEALALDPAFVREALPAVIEEYLGEVRSWLHGERALHLLASTRTPLEALLGALVRARPLESASPVPSSTPWSRAR